MPAKILEPVLSILTECDEIADGIQGVYRAGYTIDSYEGARFLARRWLPRNETQTVIDNTAQSLWERYGKR